MERKIKKLIESADMNRVDLCKELQEVGKDNESKGLPFLLKVGNAVGKTDLVKKVENRKAGSVGALCEGITSCIMKGAFGEDDFNQKQQKPQQTTKLTEEKNEEVEDIEDQRRRRDTEMRLLQVKLLADFKSRGTEVDAPVGIEVELSEKTAQPLIPWYLEEVMVSICKGTESNSRRMKRIMNVIQLATAVAKFMPLSIAKSNGKDMVQHDPQWKTFSKKVVKFIVLAEYYPCRIRYVVYFYIASDNSVLSLLLSYLKIQPKFLGTVAP